MDNCHIGRRAKLRRAILDKNVRIPEDATVGYDLDADRATRMARDRFRHRRHRTGTQHRAHGSHVGLQPRRDGARFLDGCSTFAFGWHMWD